MIAPIQGYAPDGFPLLSLFVDETGGVLDWNYSARLGIWWSTLRAKDPKALRVKVQIGTAGADDFEQQARIDVPAAEFADAWTPWVPGRDFNGNVLSAA